MYPAHKTSTLFVMLVLLIVPALTFALDSDSQAKLHIVADSGTYNFKTGVDVYEGHVKIDQGTTHITADKLITKKNSRHKIEEATAYGMQTLAHFWTLPKLGEPEIHARAKIIKFYPLETNVSLEHDVRVIQGENSFQGEVIHYNSNEQTITLPASLNGRAVLVYNPEKQ
ncbi:Lipopolysaccharide export system protein LptA [Aquicella siphonis]|uniref:Lipopolysaccharide export system protein LptA n=1 Tax=Aquicella siphonis TaxID=254247 RepID=A0A5E4PI97_9COXI|nr:lipopolysaccharide transport periplasmic protein LptA [Aquicella siphonis]VVC76123.1 Lipopolysaccharide export system protein LptA [Aquicella siphonis]